jgi:hypothetical protein
VKCQKNILLFELLSELSTGNKLLVQNCIAADIPAKLGLRSTILGKLPEELAPPTADDRASNTIATVAFPLLRNPSTRSSAAGINSPVKENIIILSVSAQFNV